MGSTLYCRSTLQRSVATSTTEAEYMAICDLAKELKWLMNMLTDMGVTWRAQPRPVPVYEDNQSCIALLKNPGVNHSRSKHVDVKYHFTREQMVNNSLDVIYCPTEDMVADICTKPLPPAKHQKLSALIGMADSPCADRRHLEGGSLVSSRRPQSGGASDIPSVNLMGQRSLIENPQL